MKKQLGGFLVVGLLATEFSATAAAQFTISTDPPSFVPGGGPGIGWSGFGYGAYGPRGYGYYTPLPELGYYNEGGGPSGFYSPIFNAMPAAPAANRTYSSNYRPPGGVSPLPISAPPPRRAPQPRNQGRGFLGRLFGR